MSTATLSNLTLIIALFANNSSPIIQSYAQMWEEDVEQSEETASAYVELISEEYAEKKDYDKFRPACPYLAEVLGKAVYRYSAPVL